MNTETIEETQTQAETKELLYCESEIPFEVAERVVRAQMEKALDEIQSKGHFYARISMGMSRSGKNYFRADYYASGDDSQMPDAPTIEEVVAIIQPPQDEKAKKIAKLKTELAALETEGK